jgi:Kef-type K+ transport system membrane component KefB
MVTAMSPFLELAFALVLILVVARLGGFISSRLGQPSVLGELVAGILLGPSILNITHFPFIHQPLQLEVTLRNLGEMGVLLLMFLAGLELHVTDLVKNIRTSSRIAVFGVIFSIFLVGLIGNFAGMALTQSGFLGLCLAATSISITAQTLMELKVLRTRVGFALLGAAVLDDILVLLFFSVFIAIYGGGNGLQSVGELILRVVVFLVVSLGFGLFILPRFARLVARFQVNYGAISLAIIILLTFGLLAELLGGISAILGAFLAGLMYSRTSEKNSIEPGLHTFTYAFFAPIFFVGIGLQVDLHLINSASFFLLLGLAAAAILGKLGGAGVGARISGFPWLDSGRLGAGMIPRGEVSLIIATVGLNLKIFENNVFTAIIGAVLISTLITPILLRYLFSLKGKVDTPTAQGERRETS